MGSISHLKLGASRCLVLSMLPPLDQLRWRRARGGAKGSCLVAINKLWNFHRYWLVIILKDVGSNIPSTELKAVTVHPHRQVCCMVFRDS